MPISCTEKLSKDAPDDEPFFLLISGTGKMILDDVKQLHSFMDSYLQKPRQFKMLIDLRKVKNISMDIIKPIAQNMGKIEDAAREKVLGTAIIISSTVIENLVNMVFSIKKPTTPTKITTKIEKACDFLNTVDE